MESFRTIQSLTPEIMEAYLAGNLNDRQRHQVEKLLLEDDFASEAMEGLAMMETGERRESLQRINENFADTAGSSTRKPFAWYYAAAAAVALVAAASYFVLQETPGTTVESLSPVAMKKLPEPEADNSIAMADESEEKQEYEEMPESSASLSAAQESSPEAETADVLLEETLAYDSEADNSSVFQDTVGMIMSDVSPDRISQIDARTIDTMQIAEVQPGARALSRTQATGGRISGEPMDMQKTISGRIVLKDGMPVANVNVMINEQGGISTQTDEHGNFRITGDSEATLVFSLMGLESTSIQGNRLSESADVIMQQESVTLSEQNLSSRSEISSVTHGARPTVSDEEYQAYLKSNVVQPEVDEKLSGDVVIRVTIEADGTISNTKILEALSEPYNIEAIRLIREGPAWQPALENGKPVADKVRVKISF